MPTFQDQMMKDLDDVFLSAPAMEFVTEHLIGGVGTKPKKCQIVVDRERYIERKIQDKVENVSLNGLTFFIKKADWIGKFGHIPKIDSELAFDGKRYLVEAVVEDMGLLEFMIQANRGR